MCTAAAYKTKDFYFGRTLDYEFSYGEEVVVTPRRYRFRFEHQYAMIGMAHVAGGYPLYYDALNEKGLAMAGLNFVGNAVYRSAVQGMDNIAPYEFIPWVLGQCSTVKEARLLLEKVNLVNKPFSGQYPLAELHWMIAGQGESIVVEAVEDGVHVYDNQAGVMTNNPPFPEQMFSMNRYMSLSAGEPENRFSESLPLRRYSRGMGAIGLPGDLSSNSRFVRAAFMKMNSVCGNSEPESVSQFFHIMETVGQVKGCCRLENGEHEFTIYTSCSNTQKGIYYYTTYGNRQITAVDMHKTDLDAAALSCFPLVHEEQIKYI